MPKHHRTADVLIRLTLAGLGRLASAAAASLCLPGLILAYFEMIPNDIADQWVATGGVYFCAC